MQNYIKKFSIRRFVKIVFTVVGAYITIFAIVLTLYGNTATQFIDVMPVRSGTHAASQAGELEIEYRGDNSGLRPPPRTNFVLVGLDNNLLADAIMVGTLYRDTGALHIMPIPRDTYTHLPPHRMQQMQAHGLNPPQVLKINAVRAFGGRAHGMHYLQAQLGEMLGVRFHYYVEVELAAFRRIVDAIGGVTMYIPRHLFYEDPCQGLFIDIPQGLHHLDGAMAEGVIRYRRFPTGDLGRNNIQGEFMAQLMSQALTRDAIMGAPLAIAGAIISDVRTNATILDIARYAPYMTRMGQVETFSLPGSAKYIDGVSWFVPDTEKLPGVVNAVFFDSNH